MSAPTCGFCGAPTLNGALCRRDWGRLLDLLRRCDGLEGDLQSAIGRRARFGEQTRRARPGPGVPFNAAAAEARESLLGVLRAAAVRLELDPVGTVDDAAGALLAHREALRGSWVAAVLLGEVEYLVPGAVRATDIPRGRPGVRAVCPRCGERTRLVQVMGALRCSSCRELLSLGEVDRAV